MDEKESIDWLSGSFQDWWHSWQAESKDMRNIPDYFRPFCRTLAEVGYTAGAATVINKIAEDSKKRWGDEL